MSSKRSFCNAALIMDACNRTLWVGIAYLAVGLLSQMPQLILAPVNLDSAAIDSLQGLLLAQAPEVFGIFALVFSTVSVGAAFEFLFKKSSAEFYGSLPVSRESLFVSRYLAALLPLLVADVLMFAVFGIMGMQLGFRAATAFEWLFIVAALDFLFVSMASFCAQFASSNVFYILFVLMANGYVWALEHGIRAALEIFTFGVCFSTDFIGTLGCLSPLAFIATVSASYLNSVFVNFIGFAQILIPYMFAAAIITIIAAILFTRRKLEHAGDGLAFPKTRLFFGVAFAFAAGLGFSLLILGIFDLTNPTAYWAASFASVVTTVAFVGSFLAGSLVAYGVFEVVLGKGVQVLRQHFDGFVILACLVAICGIGISIDLFNFSGNMPEASKVESVQVGNSDFVSDEDYILDALELQRQIVADAKSGTLYAGDVGDCDGLVDTVCFCYSMKDGSALRYYYDIAFCESSKHGTGKEILDKVTALVNSSASTKEVAAWMEKSIRDYGEKQCAISIEYSIGEDDAVSVPLNRDMALRLYREALKKDILEHGAADIRYGEASEDEGWLSASIYFYFTDDYYDLPNASEMFYRMDSVHLCTEHSPNTVKWLEKNMDVKLEKSRG